MLDGTFQHNCHRPFRDQWLDLYGANFDKLDFLQIFWHHSNRSMENVSFEPKLSKLELLFFKQRKSFAKEDSTYIKFCSFTYEISRERIARRMVKNDQQTTLREWEEKYDSVEDIWFLCIWDKKTSIWRFWHRSPWVYGVTLVSSVSLMFNDRHSSFIGFAKYLNNKSFWKSNEKANKCRWFICLFLD